MLDRFTDIDFRTEDAHLVPGLRWSCRYAPEFYCRFDIAESRDAWALFQGDQNPQVTQDHGCFNGS